MEMDISKLEFDFMGTSVICRSGSPLILADLKKAFFGIFDGHGGAKAAEYAANNLEKNVLDEVIMSDEDDVEEAVKRGYGKFLRDGDHE